MLVDDWSPSLRVTTLESIADNHSGLESNDGTAMIPPELKGGDEIG